MNGVKEQLRRCELISMKISKEMHRITFEMSIAADAAAVVSFINVFIPAIKTNKQKNNRKKSSYLKT